MFNFLKNTDSTEKKLRDWAFKNCMRFMRASDEPAMRTFNQEMDVKKLVRTVVNESVHELREAESSMRLVGRKIDPTVERHLLYGLQLVGELAKEHGWKIEPGGGGSMPHTCAIDGDTGR